MKKFKTIKVTFEAYISVFYEANMETLEKTIDAKLSDQLEMFCTDNSFGLADCQVTLEIQE